MCKSIISLTIFILLILSGCVRTYKLVPATEFEFQSFSINLPSEWNLSPYNFGSQSLTLTKDGELLNHLILISNIKTNQRLFQNINKKGMPSFSTNSTLSDLQTFITASIGLLYEKEFSIETSQQQEIMINGHPATKFLINYQSETGLERSGIVVGIIKNDKLSILWYDAASLHYFDQYAPEVNNIIQSIRII